MGGIVGVDGTRAEDLCSVAAFPGGDFSGEDMTRVSLVCRDNLSNRWKMNLPHISRQS